MSLSSQPGLSAQHNASLSAFSGAAGDRAESRHTGADQGIGQRIGTAERNVELHVGHSLDDQAIAPVSRRLRPFGSDFGAERS